MNNEKIKPEPVKLKIGEIVLPKIDVTQYIGKKARIASVVTLQGDIKGKKTHYVQISTTPVDVIKRAGNDIEIKATRNFSLGQDVDGNWGWGADTKLGQFLASKNVKHPDQLIGREVMIQVTEDEKFLTFI